jgi:hypothetical protein
MQEGSGLTAMFAKEVDDSLTWDFLPWMRSITRLPIMLKVAHHAEAANSGSDCQASAANGCASRLYKRM